MFIQYDQSEYKGVVLLERGLLLEHVLHQRVDLLARHLNLVIESLLLATFLLELDQLVLLVQHRLDPALLDHFSHEIFRLVRLDAQKVAQLAEPDIHVDAADHDNVVLDQSFVEDGVAIAHRDILEILQVLRELLHVCLPNDLPFEHLGKQVVKLVRFTAFITVKNGQKTSLSRSGWRQNRALESTINQLFDL